MSPTEVSADERTLASLPRGVPKDIIASDPSDPGTIGVTLWNDHSDRRIIQCYDLKAATTAFYDWMEANAQDRQMRLSLNGEVYGRAAYRTALTVAELAQTAWRGAPLLSDGDTLDMFG
jgi:hypothetical protein